MDKRKYALNRSYAARFKAYCRDKAFKKRLKNAKPVLGHSDVTTTLRHYVDVFPEDLEEAAEMLAER